MKKLILLIGIIISLNSYSQVLINGININDEDITYCQIVGKSNLLATKVKIFIDYGQKFSWTVRQIVKTPQGEVMKFNSMIDALNFMQTNGWTYINNYVIRGSGGTVYHYLLKK